MGIAESGVDVLVADRRTDPALVLLAAVETTKVIKKFFKIFEIHPEYHGVYKTDHKLMDTNFFSVNHYNSHAECEQVIENLGKVGVQYAILEVWEKEL